MTEFTRAVSVMDESNRIVNGLWIGNRLSKLELLTICSFLANGHDFHLWTYSDIRTPLPAGVRYAGTYGARRQNVPRRSQCRFLRWSLRSMRVAARAHAIIEAS